MGITPFLVMGAILFGLGMYVVCTRDNAVAYLMGIELILNAASLNFIAFSHFNGTVVDKAYINAVDGQVFSLFVIALAACESVVALAIALGMYRHYHSIDTSEATSLKG
jgi:NADH-quinone oxidoreductase subunit K